MSRKRQENNINKEKENLSLLDLILKEREKGENVITGILSIRPPEDMWRGLIALPPSTLLEDIVAEFDKKSNIPLELPFFNFFHYLAALLLQKSVTLHVNDITIRPDIWTVLLAESGAGKTTLADILTGTLHMQQGDIYIDGKPLEEKDFDNIKPWSFL